MTELEEKILARCLKLQKKHPSTYTTRACVKRHTRQLIFKRDGYKCLRCGAKENLTIDHIVPLVMDGVKKKFNLQTLCDKCNGWKADRIICFRSTMKISDIIE